MWRNQALSGQTGRYERKNLYKAGRTPNDFLLADFSSPTNLSAFCGHTWRKFEYEFFIILLAYKSIKTSNRQWNAQKNMNTVYRRPASLNKAVDIRQRNFIQKTSPNFYENCRRFFIVAPACFWLFVGCARALMCLVFIKMHLRAIKRVFSVSKHIFSHPYKKEKYYRNLSALVKYL